MCLNPYSNGMLTWQTNNYFLLLCLFCLNPYSNGMLTWTVPPLCATYSVAETVLILILMECSLGAALNW